MSSDAWARVERLHVSVRDAQEVVDEQAAELRAALRELADSGVPPVEIAARLGVSRQRVGQLLGR